MELINMKFCPECGYNNPKTRDFCQECGINLKTDIEKTNNKPAVKNQVLYKVDKKTGDLRVSKTKSFSLISFSLPVLICVLIGLILPFPIWGFIIAGIILGSITALITYVIGYGIAGLIEKFNF